MSAFLSYFSTAAYAQSASGGGFDASSLTGLLPFVAVFAIVYFIMIRPQQKKAKKLKDQLKNLRRGDRVLTAGGIIGIVQKTQDDASEIDVEIAPNVRVVVLRDTISTVLNSTAKPANDTKKAS